MNMRLYSLVTKATPVAYLLRKPHNKPENLGGGITEQQAYRFRRPA
jgi:hypothetical protein